MSASAPSLLSEAGPKASKPCSKCLTEKPLADFASIKQNRDGRSTDCKTCRNAVQRARYAASEHIRTRQRGYMVRHLYGMEPEQHAARRAAQNDACAVCVQPLLGGQRECIDHDHSTGKVRGILCMDCNTSIGKLGDNVAGLERALAYLKRT